MGFRQFLWRCLLSFPVPSASRALKANALDALANYSNKAWFGDPYIVQTRGTFLKATYQALSVVALRKAAGFLQA